MNGNICQGCAFCNFRDPCYTKTLMKKKYKALMLDLDGTTIPNRKNGGPTQRVITAIKKANKKLAVCVVTGRQYFQAQPLLEQLQLSDYVVFLNGAQIIDLQTKKSIYRQPLLEEDKQFIIQLLKEHNIPFLVYTQDKKFEGLEYDMKGNVFKVTAIDITDEQAQTVHHALASRSEVIMHNILSWTPEKMNLDISHVSATKQHGIFEVAKQLHIEPHEIIGIGDGPNDFPMLMACGLKVAMGNAVDDLKEIADYVAPTVDEDGVAYVIEKFVLQ